MGSVLYSSMIEKEHRKRRRGEVSPSSLSSCQKTIVITPYSDEAEGAANSLLHHHQESITTHTQRRENFRQPFIRRQAYPPNKTTTGRFRDVAALVRELLGSGFAGVKGLDHGESFAFCI